MLFCIQNLKNCPTSEYGFLKIFATCEQWVCIYRTYCSLGCKNNNIILIENIYTLSPHYMVQTTLLFSLILFSHLSPSLSQLQKLLCPCHSNHFLSLYLFFFLFTVLLYTQTEDSRVFGLILGFVWNFWVSQWSVLPLVSRFVVSQWLDRCWNKLSFFSLFTVLLYPQTKDSRVHWLV